MVQHLSLSSTKEVIFMEEVMTRIEQQTANRSYIQTTKPHLTNPMIDQAL